MEQDMLITKVAAIVAFMAAAPCWADAGDAYNASNGTLQIPQIIVGNTMYGNVVITIGSIVSVGGSKPMSSFYLSQGGLTWMPIIVNSSPGYTYAEATALCAGTINGQTGWRLPTNNELLALSASSVFTPTTPAGWVAASTWSSTPSPYAATHYIVNLSAAGTGTNFASYDTNQQLATCVHSN